MVDNPGAEERRREDIHRAIEAAQQLRLESAVEEYLTTAHVGTPREEREASDEALRAEYAQALAEQPPLITNPPEGPLIQEDLMVRLRAAAPEIVRTAADAAVSTTAGVPEAVTVLVTALENLRDAKNDPNNDVEGRLAKAVTAVTGFVVDVIARHATPPGTADINVDATADEVKKRMRPLIEGLFGKAPPDEDDAAPDDQQ